MKVHLAVLLALFFGFSGTVFAEQSGKPLRAAGRVDAITNDSITIQVGPDKKTFAVDSATRITGRGIATKLQKSKAERRSPAITELVEPSNSVVVAYMDVGDGKLRATETNVRLITKQ